MEIWWLQRPFEHSTWKLTQNTRQCLCSFLLSKFWAVIVASVSCWEEWPPSDISHHQLRPANNHAMFTDTYITSFPFLMLSLNFSILTMSTLSYCRVIGCVFALTTSCTSVPYKVSSEYNCWGAKITTHFMLYIFFYSKRLTYKSMRWY